MKVIEVSSVDGNTVYRYELEHSKWAMQERKAPKPRGRIRKALLVADLRNGQGVLTQMFKNLEQFRELNSALESIEAEEWVQSAAGAVRSEIQTGGRLPDPHRAPDGSESASGKSESKTEVPATADPEAPGGRPKSEIQTGGRLPDPHRAPDGSESASGKSESKTEVPATADPEASGGRPKSETQTFDAKSHVQKFKESVHQGSVDEDFPEQTPKSEIQTEQLSYSLAEAPVLIAEAKLRPSGSGKRKLEQSNPELTRKAWERLVCLDRANARVKPKFSGQWFEACQRYPKALLDMTETHRTELEAKYPDGQFCIANPWAWMAPKARDWGILVQRPPPAPPRF